MMDIEPKKHPGTGELIPEEWREVDGYDGWYEVSNYGRVRSWKKKGPSNNRSSTPKILSICTNNHDYSIVNLCMGTSKIHCVHRLVGSSFVANPYDKPTINHKDGDKNNNFYLNLEWATQQENISHAWDTGLSTNRGENNHLSKLLDSDVLNIRRIHEEGIYLQREIAEMFGISSENISRIVNRKTWTHI